MRPGGPPGLAKGMASLLQEAAKEMASLLREAVNDLGA